MTFDKDFFVVKGVAQWEINLPFSVRNVEEKLQ